MAFAGYDSYKFPEVQIDSQSNYPGATGNIKKITVEEWNDILHHTHKVGTFVDDNGNFVDASGSPISLSEYNELKQTVLQLQEQNANLLLQIQSLTSRISAIENNPPSSGLLIDYDLDTPGTQDEHGNTIEEP